MGRVRTLPIEQVIRASIDGLMVRMVSWGSGFTKTHHGAATRNSTSIWSTALFCCRASHAFLRSLAACKPLYVCCGSHASRENKWWERSVFNYSHSLVMGHISDYPLHITLEVYTKFLKSYTDVWRVHGIGPLVLTLPGNIETKVLE